MIEVPKEYNNLVEYYQKCEPVEAAIAAEIIKYASFSKKGLKPDDEKTIGSLGKGYGIEEDFTKKQISKLEQNGLLVRVKTKKFGIIPQETIRTTEKGLYVLHGILKQGYDYMIEHNSGYTWEDGPILTREEELESISNALKRNS